MTQEEFTLRKDELSPLLKQYNVATGETKDADGDYMLALVVEKEPDDETKQKIAEICDTVSYKFIITGRLSLLPKNMNTMTISNERFSKLIRNFKCNGTQLGIGRYKLPSNDRSLISDTSSLMYTYTCLTWDNIEKEPQILQFVYHWRPEIVDIVFGNEAMIVNELDSLLGAEKTEYVGPSKKEVTEKI